ncbi:hypothetical protein DF185_00030 [Marinifilum breve]|uniref:Uncharacterized protein n=1 Tax=Marinifilum breve TaxID=2184082 RepID=A0A2V4A3P0_9BACT|nr:hypothetical protein [Marinifilum breve]PXY02517.1 hypothetical protein DF185_00030 [Marinifilum breve]
MRKTILFFLCLYLLKSSLAQQVGVEQLVAKQTYRGIFKVGGDKDTYYPVVFKYGGQNEINNLVIFRSYHEAGPDKLSPTHKGGLTLEIDVNYGGWGGSTYDWRIMDYRQTYHSTFGKAEFGMHYKGFIVWLRGGGFIYHYESEKPANLQVCYASEQIFDDPNPIYDVYAPPAITQVDETIINAHRNDCWEYIKRKPFDQRGHLGILTPASNYPLDVNGTIRAKEIKVETNWADFVFEENYQLMKLSELEEFIKENGHLPEIPTEEQVEESGISLGEMNSKLLQKVEELTLYVIQLSNENKILKSQIKVRDEESNEIDSLRKEIEKINSILFKK